MNGGVKNKRIAHHLINMVQEKTNGKVNRKRQMKVKMFPA
jgi:hypothetical protein